MKCVIVVNGCQDGVDLTDTGLGSAKTGFLRSDHSRETVVNTIKANGLDAVGNLTSGEGVL